MIRKQKHPLNRAARRELKFRKDQYDGARSSLPRKEEEAGVQGDQVLDFPRPHQERHTPHLGDGEVS